MKLRVNKHEVHVATGGKEFDSALPTVVFLAGSGGDHRTWALQARWFAFHGFSVLAPDFPAHSLSAGEPLESIEESAQWLDSLFEVAGIKRAHLVGHSQGFLTALEFSARHPQKVLSLTGIGTAAAIPVNPALIETARVSAAKAADMMVQWGFGPLAHMGRSATPGMQPLAIGHAIMSASPLADDLQSCADYKGGEAAMAKVKEQGLRCAMILAGHDKMTPLKAGKKAALALNAELFEIPEHGHMLPLEAPKEVLQAVRKFILDR